MFSSSFRSVFRPQLWSLGFLLLVLSSSMVAARQDGTKPYRIEDGLIRTEIGNVSTSPDGRFIAFDYERPAKIGELFLPSGTIAQGLLYGTRRTIRIINANDGGVVWQSTSEHGRSSYLPRWSANSDQLAFLTTRGDSLAVPAVYDLRSRRVANFPGRFVNELARVGAEGSFSEPLQWYGENSVVFVRTNSTSEDLGKEFLEKSLVALRRAWSGRRSVRKWDNRFRPLCNPDDTLVILDTKTGVLRKIAVGAIRGVSLGPIGRIATLTADGHFAVSKDRPIRFPPDRIYGDVDELARWRLDAYTVSGSHLGSHPLAYGSGPIAPSTLPEWSRDGRRVGVPTSTFNEVRNPQFGALIVNIPSGRINRISSDSFSKSELDLRSQLGLAALPNSHSIQTLVGLVGFSRTDMNHYRMVMRGGELTFRSPSEQSVPVGLIRNAGIFVGDTAKGSFIWRVNPDGKVTTLATFNTYFKLVAYPKRRTIDYFVDGQSRRGVLYYPTLHRFDKPPVIVTAYPHAGPLSDDLGQGNEPFHDVFASLLSAGYAIFEVDFRRPDDDARSVTNAVLDEVTSAVNAVSKADDVDAHDLGFYGHSNGGFSALTLLSNTNLFGAIVASAPLGDLGAYAYALRSEVAFSSCATDTILTADEELEDPGGPNHESVFLRLGTSQAAAPGLYLKNSPSLNLGNATTPTLLIKGQFDTFGNGAREAYIALTRRGVPARLLYYFGESHNLSSPGNIIDRDKEIEAWFDEFITSSHH